jgi:hypothetical protein
MNCLLCGSDKVSEASRKYRMCADCLSKMHFYNDENAEHAMRSK